LVGAVYIHTLQNRLADAGLEGWSLIVLGVVLVTLMLLAPEGLMSRFIRRPWVVAGVGAAVFALLAGLRVWGEPVDWLAAGLLGAAVAGFWPGGKQAGATRGERPALPADSEPSAVPATAPAGAAGGRPVVVTTELAKDFGGVHALRGVSMAISEGELVGLVGPNGSGKTTLINLVSGAMPPSSGSIELYGTPIRGLPPHRIAHLGVARTFQIPRPFGSMTVRDNVAIAIMFGRRPQSLSEARRAAMTHLDLVGLTHLADAHPGSINLHERQLLEMARALATNPAVLLLDEALAGLNPVEIDNAVEVVRRIHRSGVSIVLVEHLLRVVNQLAGRVVVLDQGRILAEGEPGVVMREPAVVQAYLGKAADASGH
jgi:branched-chain amino acid transport system permease protein